MKQELLSKINRDIAFVLSKDYHYWFNAFNHVFNKINLFNKEYIGISLEEHAGVRPPFIMFYTVGNIKVFNTVEGFINSKEPSKALKLNKLVYYPKNLNCILFANFSAWKTIVSESKFWPDPRKKMEDKIREWHESIKKELNKDVDTCLGESDHFNTNVLF